MHKLTTKYRNKSKHWSSHSNSSGGKPGPNKLVCSVANCMLWKRNCVLRMSKFAGHAKWKNHFPGSARCPSTPKVHNIYAHDNDDDSFSDALPTQCWLGSLATSSKSNKNRVFAKMSVCDHEVVFQLDCGVETNTIGEQYVDCKLVCPTSVIWVSLVLGFRIAGVASPSYSCYSEPQD